MKEKIGSDFLRIGFKLDGKELKFNLIDELVSYAPDDDLSLQKELIKQPALYAKYGLLWTEAKKKLKACEDEYKMFRNERRPKVQYKLMTEGGKSDRRWKPTREDIDARFEKEYKSKVEKREARIRKWEDIVEKLEIIKRAWEQRSFCLGKDSDLICSVIGQGAIEPKKRKHF